MRKIWFIFLITDLNVLKKHSPSSVGLMSEPASFCCAEDSALHSALARHFVASASASVLGFRVNKDIFRYILSSDI